MAEKDNKRDKVIKRNNIIKLGLEDKIINKLFKKYINIADYVEIESPSEKEYTKFVGENEKLLDFLYTKMTKKGEK